MKSKHTKPAKKTSASATPICDAALYMSPTGNLYVPLAIARKLERAAR